LDHTLFTTNKTSAGQQPEETSIGRIAEKQDKMAERESRSGNRRERKTQALGLISSCMLTGRQ
jgi:hypothetical protein